MLKTMPIRKFHKPLSRSNLERAVVAAFMLAFAGPGHGMLGGSPTQFSATEPTVVSSVSSAATSYTLRDTTLLAGTRVREYVSGSGVVFAVTWEGPVLPNLKELLGPHFETMVAESAKRPKAGRSNLEVRLPGIVINSGGHMRAFEGSAWIPAELPAGFSADDVR